ncbi:unnamed protein product [Prorocentrum cordatum]|uniref:Uncharacterized protein n=1 Tax=Prorocentrum cordatum TaxID=2364126 RepID=A0ABN9WG71_9DINO|nr:unnamed protein product [Polarella glacialis]
MDEVDIDAQILALPARRVYGGQSSGSSRNALTYAVFEDTRSKRGSAGLAKSWQMESFLQGFLSAFPMYAAAPTAFLLAAFYYAYVALRVVIRAGRPVFRHFAKFDACRATLFYAIELFPSPFAPRLRVCSAAFLTYRNYYSDYLQAGPQAPLRTCIPELRIMDFSSLLFVSLQRHLHDVRRPTWEEIQRERGRANTSGLLTIDTLFKRRKVEDCVGHPQDDPFYDDWRGLGGCRLTPPTDRWFALLLECWHVAADVSPDVCWVLSTLSLTRSTGIFTCMVARLRKQPDMSVDDMVGVLRAVPAEDFKPQTHTFDTSTMSVSSVEEQIRAVLAALPNFVREVGCLQAWVRVKIANVGPFRKQHLLGNLACLQRRHPKTSLAACIPEGLFQFVDAPESGAMGGECKLLDTFAPLMSERNTSLVAKDFLRQYDTPKRIDGYLNLAQEVRAEDASMSEAKTLICDAYAFLRRPAVWPHLHRMKVQSAGGVFELLREREAFSFFMYLTNMCQACHSERDASS